MFVWVQAKCSPYFFLLTAQSKAVTPKLNNLVKWIKKATVSHGVTYALLAQTYFSKILPFVCRVTKGHQWQQSLSSSFQRYLYSFKAHYNIEKMVHVFSICRINSEISLTINGSPNYLSWRELPMNRYSANSKPKWTVRTLTILTSVTSPLFPSSLWIIITLMTAWQEGRALYETLFSVVTVTKSPQWGSWF